jgi:tetratricopeptide (TPR) repeat protein
LISAVDGSHLWSNTYDEPVGDALKVQDEIASNLVRALQVSVGAAEYRGRPSFKSLEAYDLYLRGLHAVDKYDKEGFESATAYFQRVLDLDPTSAPAAERLALTQMLIAVYGYLEPREAFERARLSAQRALRLDPKSSAAYHVLSVVQYQYEWNWADAERNAKEALRLNPGDAEANGNLGNVYWILGRWAEATRLYETAVSLDPLFVHWRVQLLDAQYSDGRLREAEAEARKVLQISPTFDGGHTMVGRVLLAQGKLEPALAEMQQDQSSWGLALVYYAMGRRAESDAALAQLIQDHAQDSASDIAYVYAYRDDLDQVFAWLDRAYHQKDVQLCDIKASQIDPLVKHYTHDPRFTAFLRKMNLPE